MKDFLTVKEFAELANKKPQTIYKQLDRRLKPYVKSEKGQLVISSEALEVFYDIETKNQPISTADQPNSTQNQPNSTRIDLDSTDNQPISTAEDQLESTDDNENPKGFSQENGQIEALNKLIELVQKQLEEKDKQLAVKDKQIEDLSNRLAEALQLTKGQQYIAAADKTKELIEADAVRKEPQESARETNETLKMQESDQKKEGKLSKFLGWFRSK